MTYLEKVEQAKRLIRDSITAYPDIVLGCSFGKDSMVTLHLALSVNPDIPVFSVLADTEFPETYAFAKEAAERYGLNYIEHVFSQAEGEKCCGKPKVDKTKEALKDVSAWISGVRRTEGITRANFNPVEEKNGLTKVNPILDFTELDIWRYLALNEVPINPMYQKGYRSLGCSLCSFPEEDENETERAGRWKGTPNACGECGIHTQPLR
ncbi:MAG: phosphoadenosine phosphosulfate reductase family protein [Patescibacteria group bacterium]|nr:phosphoadenosine phosphosulfate reductase family protein [Patescibacteria group bacterium]